MSTNDGTPSTPTNLSQLKPGTRAKVLGLDLTGAEKSRLLEMGLTVGVAVEVVRFAPLGDPLEIKVRGAHLSLRKSEAALIRVQLS